MSKDDDVRTSFYKAKRESCAIWISARYDNSGSADLKCGIVTSFAFNLALFFIIFVWLGGHFEGGLMGQESGDLCNYMFFKELYYSVFYNWLMSLSSLKKHLPPQ